MPPGILLLFLLATLAGLYRYNMRMAGFPRADEPMSLGYASDDYDEVVKLAEPMAADKVEFGATRAGGWTGRCELRDGADR